VSTSTANELADAGALALRLGQTDTALNILQAATQQHPQHFALRANLGSAWHQAGNYAQAVEQLTQAIALASTEQKLLEQLHLQLVRHRLLGGNGIDRLFPLSYVTPQGHRLGKLPAEELKKLPSAAVALVQKLALSFPQDGILLWQLGELACIYGDYATASELFDLCIGEYGLSNPALRQSRQAIKAVMERNTVTATRRTAEPCTRHMEPHSGSNSNPAAH
jgi:tetratricopeptide (TPR) repeat protein